MLHQVEIYYYNCIVLYCIVLYLYIYIALLAVHTNQKRFQCERPREKKAVLRERKDALGTSVNKVDRVEGRSWFAFICSRVDYCSAIYAGVELAHVDQLQSVLNAAARLIGGIPKFGHISEFIRAELHWLPMHRRIAFKILMLMRNCLAGQAPVYLRELCVPVSSLP